MPIYTSSFLNSVETYIKICEFRKKLDSCPDSYKTRRFIEKLDEIIVKTSQTKSKANHLPILNTSIATEEEIHLNPDLQEFVNPAVEQAARDEMSYQNHLRSLGRKGTDSLT